MTRLEQAQSASIALNALVQRVRHREGCTQTSIQTDEFACTCPVSAQYRLIRQVLIDLSKAEPHEAVCQAVVTGIEESCDCKPEPEYEWGVEYQHTTGVVHVATKEEHARGVLEAGAHVKVKRRTVGPWEDA